MPIAYPECADWQKNTFPFRLQPQVYVRPMDQLYAIVNDKRLIYYKGAPAIKQLETNGNEKIVKE